MTAPPVESDSVVTSYGWNILSLQMRARNMIALTDMHADVSTLVWQHLHDVTYMQQMSTYSAKLSLNRARYISLLP